jgi:hypothetical protein
VSRHRPVREREPLFDRPPGAAERPSPEGVAEWAAQQRIFVSSVIEGYRDYRQAAVDGISDVGAEPVWFERFGAATAIPVRDVIPVPSAGTPTFSILERPFTRKVCLLRRGAGLDNRNSPWSGAVPGPLSARHTAPPVTTEASAPERGASVARNNQPGTVSPIASRSTRRNLHAREVPRGGDALARADRPQSPVSWRRASLSTKKASQPG